MSEYSLPGPHPTHQENSRVHGQSTHRCLQSPSQTSETHSLRRALVADDQNERMVQVFLAKKPQLLLDGRTLDDDWMGPIRSFWNDYQRICPDHPVFQLVLILGDASLTMCMEMRGGASSNVPTWCYHGSVSSDIWAWQPAMIRRGLSDQFNPFYELNMLGSRYHMGQNQLNMSFDLSSNQAFLHYPVVVLGHFESPIF